MEFQHPHKYGLMAMAAIRDNAKFEKYRKLLSPHVDFFMENNFVNDIAPPHLSICYFSYPQKYPKEAVKKLVPKIVHILEDRMPLKIKAKGLKMLTLEHNFVAWNIIDWGNIPGLRKQIILKLSSEIEHFRDPHLDFTPHIGLAAIKKGHEEEVRFITDESINDEEMEIELDRIYIYYPDRPEKII